MTQPWLLIHGYNDTDWIIDLSIHGVRYAYKLHTHPAQVRAHVFARRRNQGAQLKWIKAHAALLPALSPNPSNPQPTAGINSTTP